MTSFNIVIKWGHIQRLIFNHVHQMNMWEYVWGQNLSEILTKYAPSSEWLEMHRSDSELILEDVEVKHIHSYVRSSNHRRITLKTFLYLVDRCIERSAQKGNNNNNNGIDTLFTLDTLYTSIAQGGSVEILQYVLEKSGRKGDYPAGSLIVTSAKFGHLPMVKYIWEQNTNSISQFDIICAIERASMKGSKSIVEYLETCTLEKASLQSLINYVLSNITTGNCRDFALNVASERGHLPIVKYIFERSTEGFDTLDRQSWNVYLSTIDYFAKSDQQCRSNAIDGASEHGHLPIVQYLTEHCRSEKCSTQAMDKAAENGHLNVVTYLSKNRTEGCTTNAMDKAAEKGNISVVEYLSENRTEGCTKHAMDKAAQNGHIQVVRYLSENRTEGCTQNAIDWASMNGHLQVVIYLNDNRTEGCSYEAIEYAASNDDLPMVKYLTENSTEPCTTFAMDNAAYHGNISVIQYLAANRTEGCTNNAMVNATKKGKLPMIQFLAKYKPESVTGDIIDKLSLMANIEAIKYLLETIKDSDKLDLKQSLLSSAKRGHLDVFQYLNEFTKGVYLLDSVGQTVQYGRQSIIQYIMEYAKSNSGGDESVIEDKIKEIKDRLCQEFERIPSYSNYYDFNIKWLQYMVENNLISFDDTNIYSAISSSFIAGGYSGQDLPLIQYLAPFIKHKDTFYKALKKAYKFKYRILYKYISDYIKNNNIDLLP